MIYGEIILRAYAMWAEGIDNNWAVSSPYICDNVRCAVKYNVKEDKWKAEEICSLITSIVGDSVQDHLGITEEEYDGDVIARARSRDARAMAFRLGMWYSLAERYGVQL